MTRFYINHFIKRLDVRALYACSPQALLPSMVVALLWCMAEGARCAIVLAHYTMSSPQESGYIVAVASTAVFAITRVSILNDKFYRAIFGQKAHNMQRLALACRYQAGYPRFFVVAAVGLARVALGNAPVPNVLIFRAVAALAAETVLEDLAVFAIDRALPARGAAPVSPEHEEAPLGETLFLFDQHDFARMPLWAHFSVVYISQIHMLLLIFFFGGGVPTILGFCEPGYTGYARGILWWPVVGEGDACA
uniref:Uncharacterized protein n=2 Tax=Zooxanthella nutricula TaxID=1333877 RepID=A0A7S2JXK9_9DINO